MGHDFGGEPRLVMASGNSGWFTAFILSVFAVDIAIVLIVIIAAEAPWWALLITGAGILFTGVLLLAILPKRYEVYDDRLVIAFAFWRWNIAMESIELAREARRHQVYAYNGVRFATKPSQAVELRRVRSSLLTRPNLIISPDDRATFLVELNTALARYRRLHGAPV